MIHFPLITFGGCLLNIAVKTTLTTCLVVTIAMTASSAVLLRGIDRSAKEVATAQGLLLARTFASSFSIPLARGQHELIQRQIDQMVELPDLFPQVARVVVADQAGRVVAHTDPTRFNELWVDASPSSSQAFIEPVHDPGSPPLLVVKVPVEAAVQFGTVEVTLSVARHFQAARDSSRQVLLGMVLTVFLLTATLTLLLQSLVVRPLRRLAEEVKRWKTGRIAPKLGTGPEEVVTVASAFDDLAERLEEHAAGLELTVAARTRALSEAYEQLQEANRQLQELASTDGLTSLPNRRAFASRLAVEIARAKRTGEPLSLVFFDLDHFKKLNDTLGHLEGDAALARVAGVLEEGRRSSDLVARWGGEEFAVLLPGTGHQAALLVAERLRQTIECGKLPGGCTISGGVATLPDHAHDERSLVGAADDALYSAKHHGRNRIHGSKGWTGAASEESA